MGAPENTLIRVVVLLVVLIVIVILVQKLAGA